MRRITQNGMSILVCIDCFLYLYLEFCFLFFFSFFFFFNLFYDDRRKGRRDSSESLVMSGWAGQSHQVLKS